MQIRAIVSGLLVYLIGALVFALPVAAGESGSPRADWTAEGNQENAFFGASVATAGDVNGDGFDDVIVGAPFYDQPRPNEGAAFVYHGSASGLSTSPNWTADVDQLHADLGAAVSAAGDVNGDGFDDVIVGAPFYDHGQFDEGRALVYQGSASGLSTSPNWRAESDQPGVRFGESVGRAGDVNGDGFDDVIVGASFFDGGMGGEGRAFVYHGSASGLATTPSWTGESDQAGAYFGESVGTAGDVNGDGFDEVIVGSRWYENGESSEGRAFVYHGSASGLATSPNWTAEGDQQGAFFGNSVGTAGDVNGDGFDDVIVGATSYSNDQPYEGRAFVYHGSASGLVTTPSWTAESDQSGSIFGESVGTAGDVNGDRFDDVIVGALQFENAQTDEGRAFLYRGSAAGLRSRARTAEGDQEYAHYGVSVGTAGDVNGDGLDDVIIGAEGYDNGEDGEGAAFALFGRA